jgi:DNA (cytosine-5)-methyltransferase 1
MNIFELMHEPYHLPHNPKLFEAFSGIGCQRMAFDRLGIEYEMIGFSEIDKYAIKSYMAIHGDTKNFGSICDIQGKDLPQIDVFTYSFPCTDLSKAGKQKGLSQTRSGLVYEVLRILQELNTEERLPKVLIMENVVDLVQVKFVRQFQEIQLELENLGYTNYTQTLNAKDYGVAQNRDRVFMVSILGDYYYEFPQKIKLEKRLKDYLEDYVSISYWVTKGLLNAFMSNGTGKYPRRERFLQNINRVTQDIANAITTIPGNRPTDNFIKVNDKNCETGLRKLTPMECWRLMGIDDKDFDKAKVVNSNAQLYKQAGNGIVVDVFAAIVRELL